MNEQDCREQINTCLDSFLPSYCGDEDFRKPLENGEFAVTGVHAVGSLKGQRTIFARVKNENRAKWIYLNMTTLTEVKTVEDVKMHSLARK